MNDKKEKITKYHDIILAPGLKKDYLVKDEVFTPSYIKILSQQAAKKLFLQKNISPTLTYYNNVNAKWYRFSDSDGIIFNSLDLFYQRFEIAKNFSLGIDAGIFSLKEKKTSTYKGIRYGASLYYKNFQFRLGINKYDDFSQLVPSIFYNTIIGKHSLSFEYTHQNGLFYTYRVCSYLEKMDAHHLSISDYITFSKDTNLWSNLSFNKYDNNDLETIGQFDWIMYHDKFFSNEKLTYNLALEGWYTSHSKPNDCFYSPSFADSTLLRIDPQYRYNKYIGVKGSLGAGYSFSDQQTPYKYGLWFFANPKENLSYEIGCLRSNSGRISSSGYHYNECKANLGYAW